MFTAFVMLDVEVDRVQQVAEAVCRLEGVSEVHSVTGPHDLLVKVRVSDPEAVADVVTGAIAKVPGIRDSQTILAFRAYTRDDLDAGFALGQDPSRG